MSVHEPPQFTPAQVLEAGRRAEAEGRGEYALQFYRHLADHYPGTGEAAAAQSALSRLASMGFTGVAGRPAAPPPLPASPSIDPRLDMPASGPPLSNPFEAPRPYDPGFQPASNYQPPHHAPPGLQPAPAPSGGNMVQYAPLVELPEPLNDYRSGRFLARLFAWLGGLEAITGLALLALAFVRPRIIEALPVVGGLGAGAAVIIFLAGLFQLLVGQAARAMMEQSIAARDMAAIARAEAEARHPDARRSQRY